MPDLQTNLERSLNAARQTLSNAIEDDVDRETIAILEETVARFEALAAKRGIPIVSESTRVAPMIKWGEPVTITPAYTSEPVDRIY